MPDDRRRIGVIAFGEGTWPIGPPGSSPRELETALAAFERDHPRGAGRTDTVCALFTAERWLRAAPRGARREILLLTDGDLPHSGRFTRCASTSAAVREACEARRNRSACPSAEALGTSSDLVQLAHFPRRTRRRVQVTPVVFDADRSLSTYRRLAEESGGRLVALPSADELDTALPTLLATRIDSVIAENLTTGERSPDLRLSDGERFAGAVQLAPGPNDVELRVETDEGTASRFRIRVHSARGELQSLLRDLRRRNAELSLRDQQLLADAPAPIPTRHLQITPD